MDGVQNGADSMNDLKVIARKRIGKSKLKSFLYLEVLLKNNKDIEFCVCHKNGAIEYCSNWSEVMKTINIKCKERGDSVDLNMLWEPIRGTKGVHLQ